MLVSNERATAYIGRCPLDPTGSELEVRALAQTGANERDASLNVVYHRPGGDSTYEEMLRFPPARDSHCFVLAAGSHRAWGWLAPVQRVAPIGEIKRQPTTETW